MRYYSCANAVYPEYKGSILPFSDDSRRTKFAVAVGTVLAALGFIMSVYFGNAAVFLYLAAMAALFLAMVSFIVACADALCRIRYQFCDGKIMNSTRKSSCQMDATKSHYICRMTVSQRHTRNQWEVPCYAFSHQAINSLQGYSHEQGFGGIQLLHKEGIVILPRTEELDQWVRGYYRLEQIPEFPDCYYCDTDLSMEPEYEDV